MDEPHASVSPSARVERITLDEDCWLDVVRGLVPDAGAVHDELAGSVAWRQARVFRYERWVDEPRLLGRETPDRPHPALVAVHRWLTQRYRVRFDGPGLARYRHERDSVGWHRDRDLRWLDETVVAILTLGATRPFVLKPLTARRFEPTDMTGAVDVRPAGGDVVVMGGRCQAAWLHAVPKLGARTGSRISAQWRWTSRRGRPDTNPSFFAPRHYSRPSAAP
jgi:alkylated DNA repair dioxygenase AlkB